MVIPLNAWQIRASPATSQFEVTTWPDARPAVEGPQWTMHAVSHDGRGRPLSQASQMLALLRAFHRLVMDGFDPDDVDFEMRKIAGYEALSAHRPRDRRAPSERFVRLAKEEKRGTALRKDYVA